MTRKDYILIAEALRFARENSIHAVKDAPSYLTGIDRAAQEITERLAFDNPRFNGGHFLAVVRGEKELLSRPSRNGRQS